MPARVPARAKDRNKKKSATSIEESTCVLLAEQLRHAFEGEAWHGPALLELLADVDAATAAAKPIPAVHSIWELVLHIAVWDNTSLRRLAGEICQPEGTDNFPIPPKPAETAWRKAIADTKRTHNELVKVVESLPDSRLRDRVPGKNYNFYFMLHGIAQHELYHAGQIAILKKAVAAK